MPKAFKFSPKWRNVDKSGHTGHHHQSSTFVNTQDYFLTKKSVKADETNVNVIDSIPIFSRSVSKFFLRKKFFFFVLLLVKYFRSAIIIIQMYATPNCVRMSEYKFKFCWGAAIAQWICLRLPSFHPGFESQAHHLCFYQFELCHVEKTKIIKCFIFAKAASKVIVIGRNDFLVFFFPLFC